MLNDTSKEIWKRNCKHRGSTEPLGCVQNIWEGGETVVDECICESDFCNAKMGPIPETTSSTTTASTTTKKGFYFAKKKGNNNNGYHNHYKLLILVIYMNLYLNTSSFA